MGNLDNCIQTIITSIPAGRFFDTHMVIQALIQQYADDYIQAAASFSTLISFHGHIGKSIRKLEGTLVEDMGIAHSKNVKDGFTECECWKRK
jgi:hypothetical protein